MEKKNSYQVFMEEAPEAAAAFNGLIQSLAMPGGLDQKTMRLIYTGIKVSQGNADAVCAHVPMAKLAGAVREEIKNTLTLTVSGVSGVLGRLGPALPAHESC
jgi:alkylhydroperoxidase/carboxymuconolactone decarboxylase family protein YurZ